MITGAVRDYRRERAAVALVQRRVAWRDDELGAVAGRRAHRDRVGEGGARGLCRQHNVNPKPRLTGDSAMPQARLAAAERVGPIDDAPPPPRVAAAAQIQDAPGR